MGENSAAVSVTAITSSRPTDEMSIPAAFCQSCSAASHCITPINPGRHTSIELSGGVKQPPARRLAAVRTGNETFSSRIELLSTGFMASAAPPRPPRAGASAPRPQSEPRRRPVTVPVTVARDCHRTGGPVARAPVTTGRRPGPRRPHRRLSLSRESDEFGSPCSDRVPGGPGRTTQ